MMALPILPSMSRWLGGLLLVTAAGLSSAADAPPLRVVASFSILADLAREVGGPDIDVRSLVPAGADAHVFTPTPADAALLAKAQLVIVNGLRHEGWMARLVKAAGYRGELLTASTGVKVRMTTGGARPARLAGLGQCTDLCREYPRCVWLPDCRPERPRSTNAPPPIRPAWPPLTR